MSCLRSRLDVPPNAAFLAEVFFFSSACPLASVDFPASFLSLLLFLSPTGMAVTSDRGHTRPRRKNERKARLLPFSQKCGGCALCVFDKQMTRLGFRIRRPAPHVQLHSQPCADALREHTICLVFYASYLVLPTCCAMWSLGCSCKDTLSIHTCRFGEGQSYGQSVRG